MIGAIQSALSGVQAFTVKVEKNGNNIANMNTDGFKRDRVVLSAQPPQGVRATSDKVTAPGPVAVEATGQGEQVIEQSNVDLGQEIPDMLLNQQGVRANLKTVQVADQMLKSLLDVKA